MLKSNKELRFNAYAQVDQLVADWARHTGHIPNEQMIVESLIKISTRRPKVRN